MRNWRKSILDKYKIKLNPRAGSRKEGQDADPGNFNPVGMRVRCGHLSPLIPEFMDFERLSQVPAERGIAKFSECFIISILIRCPFADQKQNGDYRCHQFGGHNGYPDAINAPKQRKNQHCGYLEQQGTQKRDQSRNEAVVKCGKEGGTINSNTRKKK